MSGSESGGLMSATEPDDDSGTMPEPPNILIPDASVAIKWFLPEADSDAALRLLDARYLLRVPSYFYTEAASVLQRRVAIDRVLSETEALKIFGKLRELPINIHLSDDLLEDAIKHGIRYKRPVYDSLYLLVAASCGGRVVTADGRLYRGVKGGPLDHLVLWVTDTL